MSRRFYITTSIPYVNGEPHVGFALELVQADVLARHRRLRGGQVRALTGTDDNALSNVRAAEAEGVPTAELVARNAGRFAALHGPLELRFDDFIRTSVDERHRVGVERLWEACAARGDLYERDYEGLYCVGCEAFLADAELVEGRCPEHLREPEPVAERNWFFRLSRHRDELLELLESGRLRIEPDVRLNEALAFVRAGLEDFSVSRSRERARGWGLAVPGDPQQVIYVWFDALGNYVTALEYGTGGDPLGRWWLRGGERVHVIGKGILRFHAVYWPAILLSAGLPLPTAIFVHPYLSANGRRLSKSLGNIVDPAALVERFGADALRWWLLRDVPRAADADYRDDSLVRRANAELANGLGNLVSRSLALGGARPDAAESPQHGETLTARLDALSESIDDALGRFDLRAATDALWSTVVESNRFVERARPWELAGTERASAVGLLLRACRVLGQELEPFLPGGASRIRRALEQGHTRPIFPRLV